MKNSSYFLFEFKGDDEDVVPLVFQNPIQILSTDEINEVGAVFEQADAMLGQGYYVAGYVSYEAAPAFDQALTVHDSSDWPLVWFGVFHSPQSLDEDGGGGTFDVSSWEMKGDFASYQKGIKEVKTGIEQGDTYQVNFTTRLEATFSGDDFAFYKKLVRNQQSSYSAYLNMGERRLLSASPELFFRIDGQTLKTKPMKGTAERGRYSQEDERQKQHLQTSDKERSENLMIVDLLRNDLGRIALPGTVRVPKLFEVETYPTVHQMTSTIEASLPENYTMFEVFRALFPCGSITGAPKVRTMEYIRRLEDSPREVYCGAIGYMTPEKEAVFNVPIRTVMIDQRKSQAVYGSGGGVTWDSTSKGEFDELHTKARLLTEDRPSFKLLETMKLEDGDLLLLSYHLDRVLATANYFNYPVELKQLKMKITQVCYKYPEGLYKLRMLVGSNGRVDIEAHPIGQPETLMTGVLSKQAIDEENPFLYHKTTNRTVYKNHQMPDAETTLLWNSKGELTEFTIANLVVKVKGEYFTPPIDCGLLAGTFRQHLLDEGRISEKVLLKDELSEFDEVWMVNAVRGWTRVEMMKDKEVTE
jgi:para-aminobenzoate synthetase / 4-amino-4-deoxychorismate lyase